MIGDPRSHQPGVMNFPENQVFMAFVCCFLEAQASLFIFIWQIG